MGVAHRPQKRARATCAGLQGFQFQVQRPISLSPPRRPRGFRPTSRDRASAHPVARRTRVLPNYNIPEDLPLIQRLFVCHDSRSTGAVETRRRSGDIHVEPLYQPALIGTHCDGLSRFPGRNGARRDAGASQAAHDEVRRPRKAALRVVFRASSGRRNRLTMRRHRRRGPSCRGGVKHDHNKSLSTQVGISEASSRQALRLRPIANTANILSTNNPADPGSGTLSSSTSSR